MPNLPRPKPLPSVKYDPPNDVPNQMQAGGSVGQNPYIDIAGDPSSQISKPQGWEDTGMQSLLGQAGAHVSPVTVTYAPQTPLGGMPDRRYDSLEELRMRQMAANNQQTDTARLTDAVNKNQANTAAAQASGDSAGLARLNAEWERLTQSPLYQQMYGGSDANAMKQRLVNVYMKPGNPAAANDLAGAMSAAVADDVWAREATNAFGRPPNQLEWDEHWKAMNVGGRDPLTGHPQAIQNIQNTMNQLQQQNQNSSYSDYSNWAGGH